MAVNTRCVARLQREFKEFQKREDKSMVAFPEESDMQTWHYLIRGAPGTAYEGGVYVGKINFPADYPFSPPAIKMTTPSGRFKPDTKLCLSISDFHAETWNPMWNVGTILTGLTSFMNENSATYGSVETSDDTRRRLAAGSHAFNLRLPHFERIFPEHAIEAKAFVTAASAAHELAKVEASARADAAEADLISRSHSPSDVSGDDSAVSDRPNEDQTENQVSETERSAALRQALVAEAAQEMRTRELKQQTATGLLGVMGSRFFWWLFNGARHMAVFMMAVLLAYVSKMVFAAKTAG